MSVTIADSINNHGNHVHCSCVRFSDEFGLITFGEHLKCIPGTGRVVMYMVTHLYRYSVPTMKKNRRPMIDLEGRVWHG